MLDGMRETLEVALSGASDISLSRSVLDQLPIGVVIARAPSGEVLFQNARAGEILGVGAPVAAGTVGEHYVGAMHQDGRPFAPEDHAVSRVLADGRRIANEECRYRRPDGGMLDIAFDADLIRDAEGRPRFAVATFQDVTARRAAERARDALERRLAGVLEATSDSVFVVDADWRFSFLNARARAQTGSGRDLLGRVLWDAFPEAVGGPFWRVYHAAMATREPRVVREHFPPLEMTFEARAYPFEDGLAVFFRDVTAEHAADQAREQLTRELAHRVGNLFTLVTSMVKMTARTASSAAEMAEKLSGRILALSRAHDLVRPMADGAAPSSTTLGALLSAVIAPHRDGAAEVLLDAGEVALGPEAATALALVLHELATNSAKYGALARGGRLAVTLDRSDPSQVAVVWREDCDVSIAAPTGRAGFGSALVNAAARGRLGGGVSHEWRDTGVTITIRCATTRLAT